MSVFTKPVGIFGGTFDPIHHGHLRLAQEALEQCGLASVRFIPSGTPPHRESPCAATAHRLNMVRIALQGNASFVLDEREVQRKGPCYTVDTLRSLRAETGPQQPLCLLMGGDAFLSLHTWHDWKNLFELAHLVVVQRPGLPLGNAIGAADSALRQQYIARLAPAPRIAHESAYGAVVVLDMPLLEISATDIRKRCADKRSIRYLLPDPVINYLQSQNLYTQPTTHADT